ncbi:MAG: hypothetical protein AM326_10305 [Candidatus Thorarchaeota archaeon SMTZ-45]|nr:MAG: hypothetical protein AM326_10305 [Candidatus Thorarchaeota archaeon SMTZ-45]
MFDFKDITSGWETQIFSFNLEWFSDNGKESDELILRVYAPGISEKAEREAFVMKKLSEIGYPVPKIHLLEKDDSILGHPFIIMNRISGSTLEELNSKPNADRKKWANLFSRLFVDLHNLDWTYLVSNPLIIPQDDPYFIINATLVDYKDTLDRFRKSELNPILEWLKARVDRVPCQKVSITHGDFHPMNILIDEDENPFVIDWGASRVSDFRTDLAWTLLLTRAYSTQKNRDSILNGYQSITGHEIEEIDYFEVLAILRRLLDVLISMGNGPISRGLRKGAVPLMKEQMGHIEVVYNLLHELTDIRIPKVEDWIDRFT